MRAVLRATGKEVVWVTGPQGNEPQGTSPEEEEEELDLWPWDRT